MHGDFLGSHKLHDSEAVTLLVLNLPSKTVSYRLLEWPTGESVHDGLRARRAKHLYREAPQSV